MAGANETSYLLAQKGALGGVEGAMSSRVGLLKTSRCNRKIHTEGRCTGVGPRENDSSQFWGSVEQLTHEDEIVQRRRLRCKNRGERYRATRLQRSEKSVANLFISWRQRGL